MHPTANRPFGHAQGFGDIELITTALLQLPSPQPTPLLPVVRRWLFNYHPDILPDEDFTSLRYEGYE